MDGYCKSQCLATKKKKKKTKYMVLVAGSTGGRKSQATHTGRNLNNDYANRKEEKRTSKEKKAHLIAL